MQSVYLTRPSSPRSSWPPFAALAEVAYSYLCFHYCLDVVWTRTSPGFRRSSEIISLSGLCSVSWLFFGVNMLNPLVSLTSQQISRKTYPNNVVRQTNYLVACPLCHFREAFSLGLVLERVAWKINAYTIPLVLFLFVLCFKLT